MTVATPPSSIEVKKHRDKITKQGVHAGTNIYTYILITGNHIIQN